MSRIRPRIVVIGAGFGGVGACVQLLADGYDQITVVERADDIGGVWRDNTYPGAQCDIPSHLYSFSFHPKADWPKPFADAADILGYLREVADERGVMPHVRLRTEVTACRWDDEAGLWRVSIRPTAADAAASGAPEETIDAEVLISACGQLSSPVVPALPGLDSFQGSAFHTARWRHDVPLDGKRIAVIGTGASAIQLVPELAAQASHLTVFQRSAPYIVAKPNRPYSRARLAAFARIPGLLRVHCLAQYAWYELQGLPFTKLPALMAAPTWQWRRRLARDVPDPTLRAELTPDYTMGCKRILRSDDWYRTLTRPDVSVVTDPIASLAPDGIRTASGGFHAADVIVLATGFAATDFLAPIRVTGRDGLDLHDEWSAGARAYLGTAMSGFPNFFMLYGPGTGLGHNSIIFMIESQLAWIRGAVQALDENNLRSVDVRPDVQRKADQWFRAASARTVWETGCSSWTSVGGRNVNNWPGTTLGFRRATSRFELSDMLMRP